MFFFHFWLLSSARKIWRLLEKYIALPKSGAVAYPPSSTPTASETLQQYVETSTGTEDFDGLSAAVHEVESLYTMSVNVMNRSDNINGSMRVKDELGR